MKAYAYTAYTDNGRRRAGTILADTEAHASVLLETQGLYVSSLSERGRRAPGVRRVRARLNSDLQVVFTRQMAALLASDLPLEQALEAIRQGGHSALEQVAASARAALMDGAPLGEALERGGAGFPPYYLASVRAGEMAGDLATVFDALAAHLESQGEDRAQIATALIYPAFVAAVSLLVCAVLMTSVAPEIVAMFELSDQPLPPITRVVLGISDWIRGHAVLLGVAVVGLVCLAVATSIVPRLRQCRDRLLLSLPVVGRFMRHTAAVQYLRTLALVLASRHTVPSAVDNAAAVLELDVFRHEAEQVGVALRRGENLSQALRSLSIVPPVARQLISAGEVSARLAPMSARAAELTETALTTERKRVAALLEPLLMILVGVFVLTVVLAVLLPIFDLQAVVAG